MAALLAVALAAALVPTTAGSSTETFYGHVLAVIEGKAQAAGMDADVVLSHDVEWPVAQADGTVDLVVMTVDELLRSQFDGLAMPAEGGVQGTQEATVGDVLHVFIDISMGTPLCSDLAAYVVSDSSLPIRTPQVFETSPYYYHSGGELGNVRDSGEAWDVGIHGVGTLQSGGSNVDTGESGPYTPIDEPAVVVDTSIDFAGFDATVVQVAFCELGQDGWVGFNLGILLGDGIALWDGDDALPTIP